MKSRKRSEIFLIKKSIIEVRMNICRAKNVGNSLGRQIKLSIDKQMYRSTDNYPWMNKCTDLLITIHR